jgi:hypothetical protein
VKEFVRAFQEPRCSHLFAVNQETYAHVKWKPQAVKQVSEYSGQGKTNMCQWLPLCGLIIGNVYFLFLNPYFLKSYVVMFCYLY